jgi:hypothetical protein
MSATFLTHKEALSRLPHGLRATVEAAGGDEGVIDVVGVLWAK